MNRFGFIHVVIYEPYSSSHFSAKRDYAKANTSNYEARRNEFQNPLQRLGLLVEIAYYFG